VVSSKSIVELGTMGPVRQIVGEAVTGWSEGAFVATFVGLGVGFSVGLGIGSFVGFRVGLGVGSSVGASVGVFVGFRVGLSV